MKTCLDYIIEAFDADTARGALIDLLNNEDTPSRTIQKIYLTAFDEEERNFIKWCQEEHGISDKNAAEIVDRMRRIDNLEAISLLSASLTGAAYSLNKCCCSPIVTIL